MAHPLGINRFEPRTGGAARLMHSIRAASLVLQQVLAAQVRGLERPVLGTKKWQEHQAGTRNWQYHLWGILMFEGWREVQ